MRGNLQITQRAMERNMRGVKLMVENSTNYPKKLLEMNDIIDHLANANCVRCIETCLENG